MRHGIKCNKLDDPEIVESMKTIDYIGLNEDKIVDISSSGYYIF